MVLKTYEHLLASILNSFVFLKFTEEKTPDSLKNFCCKTFVFCNCRIKNRL